MSVPPAAALLLFPAMLACVSGGRRLRQRRAAAVDGHGAIESAVFALFGLLLAFTFSGAVARYDAHRYLLTRETNAIGTAYLRLDLLPAAAQGELRGLFRRYVGSRMYLFDEVGPEVSAEALQLQGEIWRRSVAAVGSAGATPDAEKLLLPALNEMIDVTATRQSAFHMHPPAVVYVLLVLLSCGSAFLAGYGVRLGGRDWVYPVALAAAVTLTVYATLEIEYPRRGVIRLVELDQGLGALRDSMR